MNKLHYLLVDGSRLEAMFFTLKKFGLSISTIKSYYSNCSPTDGEMIMWCDGVKYPSFVFRGQEDIIEKCGERVYY